MCINIESYMNETARYRPVSPNRQLPVTTPTNIFGGRPSEAKVPERLVRVRMDGVIKQRFSNIGHKITYKEKYRYLSTEKFETMDTLNDMYISGIEPIYNFDGSISHYEYIVG